MISAGTYHTCAVLDDDKVKCWGSGDYGQLGYGDSSSRGDGPGEMGDNLPAVVFGPGRTVQTIRVQDSLPCHVLVADRANRWV